MKSALRVLLVEDSDLDAQLILRQLTTAGYRIEPQRVECEAEFREALGKQNWDLIVCDYKLPSFNAPDALAIALASELDIPFIVVSGTISPEFAVEMMRQGAQDYLAKGDLSRFVPAIERELREAALRKAHRATEEARKQAEQALLISEAHYREVFQITTDIIICVDVDEDGTFRLSHWNATSERVFGIHTDRDSYKTIPELFPPATAADCINCLKECMATGITYQCDQIIPQANGPLFLATTIHPVRNDSGLIDRMIVVARDITERKRGEESLRKSQSDLEQRVMERTAELTMANNRLRELDRLKSEFLATMSHELRTPLNSIIGFTSLVKEEIAGPINEEQRKQLGMVYSASKHLLGLINDLLDVSRIEAGHLRLDCTPFDFAGVVAETIAQIKPLALAKRIVLRPQLPPGALPMMGDRQRCIQVMLNLVHNAVKFTEKGSVDILARVATDNVKIDVLDTGIGIRPEQLGQLFEAFRQLDGSARRSYEGTGLGLYLCRKLLILMGGNITAHSVYGQGTRVSFNIPRRLKTQAA
ncbi:MAG: ATP-binding protein [Opitutaceae bacterium]|jgi:PAS domain S-box-containing protein